MAPVMSATASDIDRFRGSILDFEKVVIEGAFPEKVKALIVEEVETQLNSGDLQGVHIPTISPGFVGRAARAKGAITLDL